MLGIKDIAVYIPEGRSSNRDLMTRFDVDDSFLREKIGVLERSLKNADEDTSDMALAALEKLLVQTGVPREEIEALVVITQNPDTNLPHVSGKVHGTAKLSPGCAAFDISLGCSGYVYGLSVLQSFMAGNAMTKGVLITCDPYSKIIDPEDKNTVLLFGDAATATLIAEDPVLACGPFDFGTQGDLEGVLTCVEGRFEMNGRAVFNFALTTVPGSVTKLLAKAEVSKEEVDCYVFHQGSRFILESLAKRLGIDGARVPVDMLNTGNTVSSSIPLVLKDRLLDPALNLMVLCGFGVGLSWAGCVCKRVGKTND